MSANGTGNRNRVNANGLIVVVLAVGKTAQESAEAALRG
jgi:hypothetical protein